MLPNPLSPTALFYLPCCFVLVVYLLSRDYLTWSAMKCLSHFSTSQMREDSREPFKETALCILVWGTDIAARKTWSLATLGTFAIAESLWKEEFIQASWGCQRGHMEEKAYLELPWRGSRLLRSGMGLRKSGWGHQCPGRGDHTHLKRAEVGIPLPVMGLHRKSNHCPGEESALYSYKPGYTSARFYWWLLRKENLLGLPSF